MTVMWQRPLVTNLRISEPVAVNEVRFFFFFLFSNGTPLPWSGRDASAPIATGVCVVSTNVRSALLLQACSYLELGFVHHNVLAPSKEPIVITLDLFWFATSRYMSLLAHLWVGMFHNGFVHCTLHLYRCQSVYSLPLAWSYS